MNTIIEVPDALAVRRDLDKAIEIAHVLDHHYPSHRWSVEVSHEQGIVNIRLLYYDPLTFSNRTWAFVLKLADLATDPSMRDVVRAGGELLERWGLPRGKAQENVGLRAALNGLDHGIRRGTKRTAGGILLP